MIGTREIIKRCKDIIKKGSQVFSQGDGVFKANVIMNITTSIDNIYHLTYPKGIPFHLSTKNLKDVMFNMGYQPMHYNKVGIFKLILERFKGFTEDLEKGMITNISNIISLDLYDDMIDQAKELRQHNTEPLNRAGCVLARIVLEATLKQLCENHGVQPINETANQTNIALKGENIYSKPQFKLIDAWLGIGNTAAHPNQDFQSITGTDMDDMIRGIKDFALNYLR